MIQYRCPNKHNWEVTKDVDTALSGVLHVPCPTCKEPMHRIAAKYHNEAVVIDGHRFPSLREGKRYTELLKLQHAGLIRDLVLQKPFPLVVNGVKIGKYIADFSYLDVQTGHTVTEDAKGYRIREYVMKRKLVRALYGIEVIET